MTQPNQTPFVIVNGVPLSKSEAILLLCDRFPSFAENIRASVATEITQVPTEAAEPSAQLMTPKKTCESETSD